MGVKKSGIWEIDPPVSPPPWTPLNIFDLGSDQLISGGVGIFLKKIFSRPNLAKKVISLLQGKKKIFSILILREKRTFAHYI